jgi:hypothetical protein
VGVSAADRIVTVRSPGDPARGRDRIRPRRLAAVALGALLVLGGCSSGPVSQAGVASPTAAAPAQAASTEPSAAGSVTPSASTAATPAPTPNGPPPKPGNPTFELVKQTPKGGGQSTEEYEITWTSPEGAATSFLVYGVTDCLRYAKKYDGKPCVVRGMKIAKDKLVLLATAPADARSITVSWDVGEIDIPPYAAILIRATNDLGDSIFTIVHSENVCWECVY